MKHRVLANWKIPVTDSRLGKMNMARWALAQKMIRENERKDIKKWANILGNSVDEIENTTPDDDKAIRVYPLSMFMNPEVYNNLTERTQSVVSDSEIPPDVFEQQVQALEKGGQLTDIESISLKADDKINEKKTETQKKKLRSHVIFEDE